MTEEENIVKIKKALRKDVVGSGLNKSLTFTGLLREGNDRFILYATVTRLDGSRERVYWILQKDSFSPEAKIYLSSPWYYLRDNIKVKPKHDL